MKQIAISKLYAQKRCLIVDDSPEERTMLKRLLTELGAQHVDMAGSAEEALELNEKKTYQLVISDYELGAGRNGQQLIEELRFHKYLKATAIYILLTEKMDSQYVLHTLEYQPDEYLGKPLTKDNIRLRINNAVIKKDALEPIHLSLDNNQLDQAIALCKKTISSHPAYNLDILKILAEIYLQRKAFAQASQIYNSVLKSKAPLWAKLGLAKTYYYTHNTDHAEELTRAVINQAPLCVNAHELLAKILEEKNQLIEAHFSMSQACQLTPMSIDRQRQLAKLSQATDDHISAMHAFKAAVKHSRNSCFENLEDYIGLAATLITLSKKDDSDKSKEQKKEALSILSNLNKKFKRQPLAKIRSLLLQADYLDTSLKSDEAEQKTDEAVLLLDAINDIVLVHTSMDFNIDCAQALIARGRYIEGEKLLQQIADINTEKKYAIKIDKYLREPLTQEGITFAATLNEQGIALYEEKRFHESANYFKKVIKELPNHVGLNLNLIQALISKGKVKMLNKEETLLIQSSIKKVTGTQVEEQYRERLMYLLKQANKKSPDENLNSNTLKAVSN